VHFRNPGQGIVVVGPVHRPEKCPLERKVLVSRIPISPFVIPTHFVLVSGQVRMNVVKMLNLAETFIQLGLVKRNLDGTLVVIHDHRIGQVPELAVLREIALSRTENYKHGSLPFIDSSS
jgi:hypothetical protein